MSGAIKRIARDWNNAIEKVGKSGRAGAVEELTSRQAPEETRGSKQIVERETETERKGQSKGRGADTECNDRGIGGGRTGGGRAGSGVTGKELQHPLPHGLFFS
jgi:hypothetical protein